MRILVLSFVLALFTFPGLQSCSKTTNGKWVIYEESTQLPFWANESSDRKSKNTLETFLKSEGIIPLKIKIVGTRVANYKDCDCLTGLEYRVQVDKSQVGYMAYWGFQLK